MREREEMAEKRRFNGVSFSFSLSLPNPFFTRSRKTYIFLPRNSCFQEGNEIEPNFIYVESRSLGRLDCACLFWRRTSDIKARNVTLTIFAPWMKMLSKYVYLKESRDKRTLESSNINLPDVDFFHPGTPVVIFSRHHKSAYAFNSVGTFFKIDNLPPWARAWTISFLSRLLLNVGGLIA